MFCHKCSCELPDDADFCINCRADLRTAKRLTPPAEAAPSAQTTPADTIGEQATRIATGSAATLAPGSRITDRYEVLGLLGQGGMGAVYEVRDSILEQNVALKLMHAHLLSNPGAVRRFTQEAKVSLELLDPNIIRMRDIGQWGEQRFLTMELLEGRSLRSWLAALEKAGRQVPLETAVSIVTQVLDALSFAHERTIHRDIKPENVFLVGDEPAFRVKLLDFGIAKALDQEALTTTSMSLGTAWYMAPEQRKEAAHVDARADLYAVGVVFYEMLTGRLPAFQGAPPSRKRPEIDSAWDALVLGAMAEDSEERPQTAAEMKARIDKLRAAGSEEGPETGSTVDVEPPAAEEPPPSPSPPPAEVVEAREEAEPETIEVAEAPPRETAPRSGQPSFAVLEAAGRRIESLAALRKVGLVVFGVGTAVFLVLGIFSAVTGDAELQVLVPYFVQCAGLIILLIHAATRRVLSVPAALARGSAFPKEAAKAFLLSLLGGLALSAELFLFVAIAFKERPPVLIVLAAVAISLVIALLATFVATLIRRRCIAAGKR